jgi:predicted nucleic acid-binding protein
LNYVLDACALIAYLAEEKGRGYEAVNELFTRMEEDDISLYISVFNLIEVYYDFIRKYKSVERADEIMRQVDELPIGIIETVSHAVYRETARLKGFYRISLADAIACATAKSLAAAIVTKDREIRAVEQGENLSVLWIC